MVAGVEATLIDNGMPVVVLRASDLGVTGQESPDELEANAALRRKLETIRHAAAPLMNLGDVSEKTAPKLSLISPPKSGAVSTRTFIPHRCHKAIGVFGAVSVATACMVPGSVAEGIAQVPTGARRTLSVEHPTGEFSVVYRMNGDVIASTAILRTARKLMDGLVFPA